VPWLLLACQINVTLQHPFYIVPALTASNIYEGLVEQWFFDIISKTENNTVDATVVAKKSVGERRVYGRKCQSIFCSQLTKGRHLAFG